MASSFPTLREQQIIVFGFTRNLTKRMKTPESVQLLCVDFYDSYGRIIITKQMRDELTDGGFREGKACDVASLFGPPPNAVLDRRTGTKRYIVAPSVQACLRWTKKGQSMDLAVRLLTELPPHLDPDYIIELPGAWTPRRPRDKIINKFVLHAYCPQINQYKHALVSDPREGGIICGRGRADNHGVEGSYCLKAIMDKECDLEFIAEMFIITGPSTSPAENASAHVLMQRTSKIVWDMRNTYYDYYADDADKMYFGQKRLVGPGSDDRCWYIAYYPYRDTELCLIQMPIGIVSLTAKIRIVFEFENNLKKEYYGERVYKHQDTTANDEGIVKRIATDVRIGHGHLMRMIVSIMIAAVKGYSRNCDCGRWRHCTNSECWEYHGVKK